MLKSCFVNEFLSTDFRIFRIEIEKKDLQTYEKNALLYYINKAKHFQLFYIKFINEISFVS